MTSSKKSVRARPHPASKSLWAAQAIATAALIAIAFILPLTYIERQATETLQWSLDERAVPGSWRPAVTRTNVFNTGIIPEDSGVINVLSVVTDREKMGEPIPRRTIQSLNTLPGVRTIWYYLQEGPLEPYYGPGLWVVSVDMSMAVTGALLSAGITAAALAMWLMAYRFIWHRTSESVSKETAALRSRYVLGAHEAKEPLMAIQGCMEAVEDGVMSAEESAAVVPEEVRRIKSLVEDLGRLAWLEEEKEPVRMQTVDLWPYITAEAMACAWMESEPIRSGSSLAWADAGLVAQALSITSDWMDRREVRPKSIVLEGPQGAQTRVDSLEQEVSLVIHLDCTVPADAWNDVAFEILGRIQELQRGSVLAAQNSVTLSWRPANLS